MAAVIDREVYLKMAFKREWQLQETCRGDILCVYMLERETETESWRDQIRKTFVVGVEVFLRSSP